MKVEDILKTKGHRVATMRPESAIDTVVHRMRLDHFTAFFNSRFRSRSGRGRAS